jgi:hypothetical protein
MPGQETDHLAGHLQSRHPTVEVDPVEALKIQTDMPIKDVIHGHDTGCHGAPQHSGSSTPPLCPHPAATSPTSPATTSTVRGETSLEDFTGSYASRCHHCDSRTMRNESSPILYVK